MTDAAGAAGAAGARGSAGVRADVAGSSEFGRIAEVGLSADGDREWMPRPAVSRLTTLGRCP